MTESKLLALLRKVRDNVSSPVALVAAAEIADEIRRLEAALETSVEARCELEAELSDRTGPPRGRRRSRIAFASGH